MKLNLFDVFTGIVLLVCVLLLFISVSKAATTQEFNVPRSFFYDNWNQWLKLESDIDNSRADVIVLNWSGEGGHVNLGDRFIDFLRSSHKYIILRSTGPNYSMHSLVFCAAPHTEFTRGFLMFHLPADSGSGDVMLGREGQYDNQQHMNPCKNKGLVQQKDIDKINQDQVLYIYPDGYKEWSRDSRI